MSDLGQTKGIGAASAGATTADLQASLGRLSGSVTSLIDVTGKLASAESSLVAATEVLADKFASLGGLGGGGDGGGGGGLIRASYDGGGAGGGGGGSPLGGGRVLPSGGGNVPDSSGVNRAGGGNTMYDAIMRAEIPNSKHPYSETLGYGAYGNPGDLTKKTLAQVYADSEAIRRNPRNRTNAGPMGAFQMLGSTMMAAAKALDYDPKTTLFDAYHQQRMARWIATHQGLGAWEGLKVHPREMAIARASNPNVFPDLPGPGDADYRAHRGGRVPMPANMAKPADILPRRNTHANAARAAHQLHRSDVSPSVDNSGIIEHIALLEYAHSLHRSLGSSSSAATMRPRVPGMAAQIRGSFSRAGDGMRI